MGSGESLPMRNFIMCISLTSLYHPPNKIKVIKSKWLRLEGNVARIEDYKNTFRMFSDKKKITRKAQA